MHTSSAYPLSWTLLARLTEKKKTYYMRSVAVLPYALIN